MDWGSIVTSGGLATLFMQGIKLLIRKIKKNPTYDFPEVFYAVGIPVLNVFTPFLVFWLGLTSTNPFAGMVWLDVAKFAVAVALGSLISFLGYDKAVKPLVDYGAKLRAK